MSQYFFYTCSSDGKQIISFTYPPSLSTFSEMIERKMSLYMTEKFSHEDLYDYWVSTNEQKKYNLSNELISRIKTLEEEEEEEEEERISLALDILEKRTRLCNDENEQEYLPKAYDPFLSGPYRGTIRTIKKFYSHTIMNDLITSTNDLITSTNDLITSTEEEDVDSIETFWINKIHGLFPISKNSREFEHEKNPLDEKSSFNYIVNFLTSIDESSLFLLEEERRINSESKAKSLRFVFDIITTNPNDQTTTEKKSIGIEEKKSIGIEEKKSIGIEEISKKVPRWSYKLTDELEGLDQENGEEQKEDYEICSRKAKRVVIYTDKNLDTDTDNIDQAEAEAEAEAEEVALIRYSQQPDFNRGIIQGSMRAQRRKTVIWEIFQTNVHSPLFLDRIDKVFFFSFFDRYRYRIINLIFRNSVGGNPESETSDFEEEEEETNTGKKKDEEKKKKEEDERITISEIWDSIIFAQAIRGLMLITQSFFRKNIVLPSLIIAKNIGRMLLFQFPEWYEDLKEWNREIHVKCTYNGVPLSETEFPQDWLTDGIQIKILFPFRLKPWRRSKKYDLSWRSKKKKKKRKFLFFNSLGNGNGTPFWFSPKATFFF
ncbi:unnamed protein product [Musa acuminata subsp. malaccensis]|nr:unnamed protein product [Musa acuminata subsp. malaccensis]